MFLTSAGHGGGGGCAPGAGRRATMSAVPPTVQRVVVVIEDDPHIADLVDLYLRQADYRVYQAADGEAGLRAVRDRTPDLVVLDVGLPGALDGFEVCRQLRSAGEIPIVMLTARDGE